MQLTEKHIVKRGHEFWAEIDALCFSAKNLRNAALFVQRQSYFWGHGTIAFGKAVEHKNIDKFMRECDAYQAMPAFLAQQTLKSLTGEWSSFVAASKEYKKSQELFTGQPKPPKYKEKDGRYLLVFPNTRCYKGEIKNGVIHLSCTNIKIKTLRAADFDCVRIVPATDCYVIEVVYTVTDVEFNQSEYVAGLDLGINNLAAISSNKPGFQPVLVNGRPLKSINSGYNKHKASSQSNLKKNHDLFWTRRLGGLTRRRNQMVDNYLHRASRFIIDLLAAKGITKLVVGMNPDWKRDSRLGSQNNQNFVTIPHKKFVEQLIYKGCLAGIEVIVREESYTSKASFLDGDSIPTYGSKPKDWFASGKRIKRGLYRTKNGQLVNADVNGAYNLIVKESPNAFDGYGVVRCVVHPRKVNLDGFKPKSKAPF